MSLFKRKTPKKEVNYKDVIFPNAAKTKPALSGYVESYSCEITNRIFTSIHANDENITNLVKQINTNNNNNSIDFKCIITKYLDGFNFYNDYRDIQDEHIMLKGKLDHYKRISEINHMKKELEQIQTFNSIIL